MAMENQSLPSRSLPASPRPPPVKKSAQPPSAAGGHDTAQGMSGLLAARLAEGGGALCHDPNGLCLGSRGRIDAGKGGVYAAIAKLASQLDGTVDGTTGGGPPEVPLVTIQTEKASLLVKEYGGRTVVFRCPSEADAGESAGKAGGDEDGGSDEAAQTN